MGRLVMVILMLLVWVLPAIAGDTLTWQDCVELARKQNSSLRSSMAKVHQSAAAKEITRSGLLPQVSANAADRISKTYSAAEEADSAKTYSYGVTGELLLFDGFKKGSDLAGARETLRAAEYDYLVTSSDVRLALRTAFVELLRAQDLLGMTREIAVRRKSNLEMVSLRYDAGLEHKGSLLTAEANSRKADSDVLQAERSILLARVELNKELGRAGLGDVTADGVLDIDNIQRESPDFERLVEVTPFLKELMARKEASAYGLKSAKADLFPKIYATASGARSGRDLPVGKSGESWSYGLSVSFPIFEGGNKTAQINKVRAIYDQAQADTDGGRDSAFLSLVRSWISFQNALDKVETDRKFLEAAEERAKVARAQYDLGLVSFNDWTIIEDNLVTTTKSYLDARAGALTVEAEWVQAKGGTLDDEGR